MISLLACQLSTTNWPPGISLGTYDYVALFRTLQTAGYDRRISIECSLGTDFAREVTHALITLKAAHAAAQPQS